MCHRLPVSHHQPAGFIFRGILCGVTPQDRQTPPEVQTLISAEKQGHPDSAKKPIPPAAASGAQIIQCSDSCGTPLRQVRVIPYSVHTYCSQVVQLWEKIFYYS